jgi:hypothetical protein
MKKKVQITDIDIKYDPAYVRLQFNGEPLWVGIETKKILAYIAEANGWLYDTLEYQLVVPHNDSYCTIMTFRTYYNVFKKQCVKHIQGYVDSIYQEPELDTIDQAINERKNGF